MKSIKFLFAQRENLHNRNGKDSGDVLWVAIEKPLNSLEVLLDKKSALYQIETHTQPQIVDDPPSLKIVTLLLANRAKVNEPDNQGMTPLMHAAKGGHVAIARVLRVKGANLETKDSRGLTSIDWAKQKGYFKMVKALERAKDHESVIRAKK